MRRKDAEGLLMEEVEGDRLRYGYVALVEEVVVRGARGLCMSWRGSHGGWRRAPGCQEWPRLSRFGNKEEMGWGLAMAEAAELAEEGA